MMAPPALHLPSIVYQYGALSSVHSLALGPRTPDDSLALVRAQPWLAEILLPPSDGIGGPLARWPPAKDYRRAFWRAIVDRLEHGIGQPQAVAEELEVDERIYSAYLSTLQPSAHLPSMPLATPFGGSLPPSSSYKTFFFPRLQNCGEPASRATATRLAAESALPRSSIDPPAGSELSLSAEGLVLHPLHVTLAEEQKTISHGTTGLRTWGASLRLAELILVQPGLVFPPPTHPQQEGEQEQMTVNILELGAGVGFLGLFLATLGRDTGGGCSSSEPWPKPPLTMSSATKASSRAGTVRLTLTDYDDRVLDKLRHNVQLNDFSPSEVDVVALDWEDSLPSASFPDDVPRPRQGLPSGVRRRPDLIVAADVVYDPSIIRPLVLTLHRLLSATGHHGEHERRRPASALIASTIRNETTFGLFLMEAEAQGLQATFLPDTADIPRVFFGAEEGGELDGAGKVRIVRFTIA